MPIRRTSRRLLAAALCTASLSLATTACSDDSNDVATTTTAAAVVPNLVGSWAGSYEFPSKGKVIKTALTLVIERQEGENLFGYESFVDGAGKTIRFDLVGTAAINPADGEPDIVLTTTGFWFDISVVDETHLAARFVRADDKPTTFLVNLTKQ